VTKERTPPMRPALPADVLAALKTLEVGGFPARLNGGSVRDRLRGVEPKDYDIATTARPEVVSRMFSDIGLQVIPTGIEHGTVTLVTTNGRNIEITTLRRDVKTDGRHAVVEFGTSFADDAARRDFTINAMFEDATGNVEDFFAGRADLATRTLRFVGDPATRIREDYLRIMRFFRFWARLDFTPDPKTMPAIAANLDGLAQISQERITSELLELLAAAHPAKALAAMQSSGVLATILPELRSGEFTAAAAKHLEDFETENSDLRFVRLALLISATGSTELRDLRSLTKRLRLSRRDAELTSQLASAPRELDKTPSTPADAMEFVDRCEEFAGLGSWDELVLPALHALVNAPAPQLDPQATQRSRVLAQIAAVESAKSELRRKPLPIVTGDLLRSLSMTPGPKVGALVTALTRSMRNGDWSTPEEGLLWAQKWLADKA